MVGFHYSTKFSHASFFIDDQSDYTLVHHQASTSAVETMKAKNIYKAELRQCGKEVRHHHSDNGTYAFEKYREEINNNKKKTLTFCGVGSHHQNGRAENRIKITCNPERNILIHAMHRWPEFINNPFGLVLFTLLHA